MAPGAPAAESRLVRAALLRRLARLLGSACVAVAVVVPAAVFAGWLPGLDVGDGQGYDTTKAAPQLPPPEAEVDVAARAAIAALPARLQGIPVLSYHDVSDRYSLYAMSVDRFAEHMAALDAAGFETVTIDQVDAYLRGEASDLPARPVLLTFDDGVNSIWTAADPILARHGFQGLSFLVTRFVTDGAPGYYLSEPTIDEMVASGRWTFGAHTYNAHRTVPTRAGEGPALINRADGEDFIGWTNRVAADLARNVTDVEELTGDRPGSFAFPFAANAAPTNDARIPGRLAALVKEDFTTSFLASRLDRATAVRAGWNPYALPRLTMTRDLTAAKFIELLGHMMQAAPVPDLSSTAWEDREGGTCLTDRGLQVVAPTTSEADSVVTCRSTGHGPFAAPVEVETTVLLPSDRATGIVGFSSQTIEVEVAVGGIDVELRARTAGQPWEVFDVGTLAAYSSDVPMRLTIADGVVTATVGDVELTAAAPSDDDRGHLRLDAVTLASVSGGDQVQFLRPTFRWGDDVATKSA